MATKIWMGTTGAYGTGSNWVGGSGPSGGDDVRIPAGSGNIDGSDQSATAIGDFVVEDGYTGTIGSAGTALKIDPDAFRFSGTGLAYLDLHSAAIVAEIFKTAAAAPGQRGLFIKGSALTALNITGGSVGVASRAGETATVTTIRVVGSTADVWLGLGVSLTTLYVTAGKVDARCAATTVTIHGGEVTTSEEGAITTINCYGGTLYPQSTGTVTTLNAHGGFIDFTRSGAPRTVTTFKQNPGSTVKYDPSFITFTNRSAPDLPIQLSSQTGF